MAVCPPAATESSIQQQLTEAEAAYSRLITGRQPRVVVDANGERVEFTAVSSAALQQHIRGLRIQLARLQGCTSPALNRPLTFLF